MDRQWVAERGFTLIELAVVIAIIAILAAVAIPRFANLSDGAERAAVRDFTQKLHSAYSLYLGEQGEEPPGFADFVSITAAPTPPRTISLLNIGNGNCAIANATTIQCTNADFPTLAGAGVTVQFRYQNGTITNNLP